MTAVAPASDREKLERFLRKLEDSPVPDETKARKHREEELRAYLWVLEWNEERAEGKRLLWRQRALPVFVLVWLVGGLTVAFDGHGHSGPGLLIRLGGLGILAAVAGFLTMRSHWPELETCYRALVDHAAAELPAE